MRIAMRSLAKKIVFAEPLMKLAERYLRGYYNFRTATAWSREPLPTWFDHRADLFTWSHSRSASWIERGVFARQQMKPGDRVLDLCSGDGFYAYYLYSTVAATVDCIDNTPDAIAHAQRWHAAENITYITGDIVADEYPGTGYDVIVWNAAVEQFDRQAIVQVLERCRDALAAAGFLCGHTIVGGPPGLGDPHGLHEWRDAAELETMLGRVFAEVSTVETVYPDRRNVYFRCA